MTTPNDTPAGWYDDGSGRQRWWDGQQWGNFADEANAPAPLATATSASPDSASPKKLNVLALVSAIVAAVGFIFACIPGALILGWILLPIAFVLSIVSLFLKGDKKWLGIVGLILSIVGTIVGVMVFIGVVATSVDDAFGDGDTTVSQPSDSGDSGDEEEATEEEAPAADAQGTRENPYPLGSEISNSNWSVVVNSVNPDGNAVVSEANQFNEPAPAGSHYVIVNTTVTYKGGDSSYAAEVSVDIVTESGNVVNGYDSLAVLTDGFGLDELYKDASATGSQAFVVPDGETFLIRVTPGILADEVFIKP
ncbi:MULTISPECIES: DUF2510 domain-containing protein [Microbacterium]|uniref:DUF2510 domain-containing protein n=1 Tax=Microbacterium hydrocarbonoxydans TaxID=273678 RepID=A0A1H4IPN9_9MICO|nr:DUF2510 domain-containing protein [Microbacterium hydrocarbonoxydans]SEB36064.1 Protein of unknown function [Microbacterium hydrocarbonoxydans]